MTWCRAAEQNPPLTTRRALMLNCKVSRAGPASGTPCAGGPGRQREWWAQQDLNLRPPPCERGALATELCAHRNREYSTLFSAHQAEGSPGRGVADRRGVGCAGGSRITIAVSIAPVVCCVRHAASRFAFDKERLRSYNRFFASQGAGIRAARCRSAAIPETKGTLVQLPRRNLTSSEESSSHACIPRC